MLSKEEKDRLAEENIPLVYHVAKTFNGTNISFDELVSAGNLGYGKALENYNPDRGTKFSTYAFGCIRNEILFFLRKEKKHKDNNISDNKALSVDKNGNTLNLESTLSNDSIGERSIEEEFIMTETIGFLLEIIETLPEIEQFVIKYRYGLGGTKTLTQKDIAEQVGMSQANVSKLEKITLEKIKRILSTKYKIKNLEL